MFYKFILNYEKAYVRFIDNTFGYKNGVRIEDYATIIFCLIGGWLICFFMMAYTVPDKRRVYSDSLDKLLLIEMPDKEKEGETFIAIRRPKNFRDKLEIKIATTWNKYFGLKKVALHDARRMTIIMIIISIIVSLFIIISLLFAYTVVTDT